MQVFSPAVAVTHVGLFQCRCSSLVRSAFASVVVQVARDEGRATKTHAATAIEAAALASEQSKAVRLREALEQVPKYLK